MSLKKFIRRKQDLTNVNAELLAGVREAEADRAARRSGTRQDDEEEGEERARGRATAGKARS